METNGRVNTGVINENRAAANWCQAVSKLTGNTWAYLKVMQRDFEGLHPDDFGELKRVAGST